MNARAVFAIILILSTSLSAGLTYWYAQSISAPSIGATVEPGSAREPCTYNLYIDGSTYLAKNGATGANDYSGTVLSTVFNSILSAATSGVKICLGIGTFTLTSTVTYTSHLPFTIEGESAHLDRFYLSGGGTDPLGTILVVNGIDGFNIGATGVDARNGPIFTFRNLLVMGQDPSLEPLGDLSQTNGAGVKLVNNVAYALFENVQFHRKQYGIWLAPAAGTEIIRVYINRATFSYNNYGIFHDSFTLRYLVVENIEGYLNRFSLLKANPGYDFVGYRIDDEGSSWNVTLGSQDTPIYLTATQDVHLSRVTVVGGKGGVTNIAFALMEIQLSGFSTAYLSDIHLYGTSQRVLYTDGSPTDAYTVYAYGLYLGHNPAMGSTGYRGVAGDNPAVGWQISNKGFIHWDGGEVYATTNVSKGIAASTIYARNVIGYTTENWGGTSVADGGTISHGLAGTPDMVQCTPSVSGEFCSVTALAATTFTVAIKTHTGAAGTTQTVYWYAVFIP